MTWFHTPWAAVCMLACAVAPLPARANNLPPGTPILVRLDSEVVPGAKGTQKFEASLASSVFVNGHEVVPIGSRIEGEVRGTKKAVVLSPRYLFLPGGKRVDFNATVSEIDGRELKADEKEGSIQKKGGDTGDAVHQAEQVGMAGAGVGAMSTRTMSGMGIGAAAGVAAVIIGRKIAGAHHSTAVIPAGTQMTLKLAREMDVPQVSELSERQPIDREDRRPILHRD